ncbi:MAG: hypothetical protein ACE5JX_18455 [Acidobacteriota bacterium]
MLRTIEAIVDENGNVRLLEPLRLDHASRALVTILEASKVSGDEESPDTAALSEAALAADWERPEEDAAWAHLQQGQ